MARILVSMPDDFLRSIDKIADGEQRTRSELIREALRTYMKRARGNFDKKSSQNAELLEDLLN